MILILSKARHPKCVNHHHSSRSNGIPASSNTSGGGCYSSSPTDPDLFDLSSMNNTLRSCYYFKPIDPPTCGTSSIISTARTTSTSIETTAGAATFSPTSSSLRIENRQDKEEEEEQSPLQQQNFVPISPTAPCSTPPPARQTNKRVLPSTNQDEKVDDGFYHPHCYRPCTPPRGPSPSRTHHDYSNTPLLDRSCRRQHRRQDTYCWSPPPPPNPTRKRRRMMIGTTNGGTSAIYSTSTTTSKENLLFPFILNDEDEDKESNLFKDRENPSSCSWIVNMKNTETTRIARKKITIDRKWKLMPRKRTFVEEPIPFSSSSCNTLPATINAASKILD